MSEYLIQDTTLSGIADKIRPLLGLTGTMTPEQMQTNLATEQANITAALTALAEKGVEVPEGANSNALAGLIEAIEAGEGEIYRGTITFNQDTYETYIPQESLMSKEGFLPRLIVNFMSDNPKGNGYISIPSGPLMGCSILIFDEKISFPAHSATLPCQSYIYAKGGMSNLAMPLIGTGIWYHYPVGLHMFASKAPSAASSYAYAGSTFEYICLW